MRRTLSTRLIAAVLVLTTYDCATTYSLTPEAARRAAHGDYAAHEGVPATASDGREVKLRPSALVPADCSRLPPPAPACRYTRASVSGARSAHGSSCPREF